VFGAVGKVGRRRRKRAQVCEGAASICCELVLLLEKELHEKLCVIHSTAKSVVITPLPYENIHVNRKNLLVYENQVSLHLVILYLHVIGGVKRDMIGKMLMCR
jgi:hypothetical protein